MKALILAAGYATRLYPLTKDYPKSLLRVKGKALIDYIVDKLLPLKGLDEVIVVTNSRFVCLFRHWADSRGADKKITIIDDLTKNHHEKRGAIGDMYFALDSEKINDDIIVVGGDNLFDGGLSEFMRFAEKKYPSPVIGVYDVKYKSKAVHYGITKLDKSNRITGFMEKPKKPASTLVAMCLYYFPAKKVPLIKRYMSHSSHKYDAVGFYIDWLRKEEKVYGHVFNGVWYDIGHHSLYNEAKEKF